MDVEIKNWVKGCHACQDNLNSPAKASLHPWKWPESAWSCVHVDYAGPFEGSMSWILVGCLLEKDGVLANVCIFATLRTCSLVATAAQTPSTSIWYQAYSQLVPSCKNIAAQSVCQKLTKLHCPLRRQPHWMPSVQNHSQGANVSYNQWHLY